MAESEAKEQTQTDVLVRIFTAKQDRDGARMRADEQKAKVKQEQAEYNRLDGIADEEDAKLNMALQNLDEFVKSHPLTLGGGFEHPPFLKADGDESKD